jgi:hypothetical protein
MKIRLVLTLVFLLSTLCVPIHADENKNCVLKQLASLDLAQFPGHVLVPVAIQGKSVWMALHTGSPTSAMLEDEISALQLQRRSVFVGKSTSAGLKGTVVPGAVADDLQMGHVRVRDVRFLLVRRSVHSEPPAFEQRPIVGSIGMDVLSTVDFELDIAHGKLNLFSHDHCPGQVVYWSGPVASIPVKRGDLGELYFSIELDGKALEAVMWSRWQHSVLRTDVAQKLYGFDENSAGNERLTDPDRSLTYRLMSLTTPAFQVRNAVIVLLPPHNKDCFVVKHGSKDSMTGYDRCMGEYPLQLGISVLSKLRIYFATKEQMLYLSPADTAATDVHQNTDTP